MSATIFEVLRGKIWIRNYSPTFWWSSFSQQSDPCNCKTIIQQVLRLSLKQMLYLIEMMILSNPYNYDFFFDLITSSLLCQHTTMSILQKFHITLTSHLQAILKDFNQLLSWDHLAPSPLTHTCIMAFINLITRINIARILVLIILKTRTKISRTKISKSITKFYEENFGKQIIYFQLFLLHNYLLASEKH